MLERVITLLENLDYAKPFLVVLGLVGILVGILHHFDLLPTGPDTLIITTFLLTCLLCSGVGIGFLVLDKTLKNVAYRTEQAVDCSLVEGNLVWESLKQLVSEAEHRIRATHFGKEETKGSYVAALAATLSHDPRLSYEVVIGYDRAHPESARRLVEDRRRQFSANRVDDRVDFRYKGIQWGLDLLIIDERHLFIGLPTGPSRDAIQCGLIFRGKREFVEKVRQWYDEYLWNVAEKTL